ncbi:MAG: hypothetical protein KJ875_17750 [Alphaproteobacteria bacterium]|nr:hypothetical protein [Alphaproteobacteria bacterium]MBU1573020.1 hypothetical protein [Alphaproteobacteria bacterium]MBU2079979.1 hypothetical protein [Alphaproteobacteria bacterium]MBU2162753.1 hypothetical protein [Alphaproteobacteria bacterium]MBU2244169.1 hypothetical protein [Alphaproteobacteria bacterium]
MADNSELKLEIAKLMGETRALRMTLGILISRIAREFEDPEQYVISLLSPLHAGAESADSPDPETHAVAEAILDTQTALESISLSMLRN